VKYCFFIAASDFAFYSSELAASPSFAIWSSITLMTFFSISSFYPFNKSNTSISWSTSGPSSRAFFASFSTMLEDSVALKSSLFLSSTVLALEARRSDRAVFTAAS